MNALIAGLVLAVVIIAAFFVYKRKAIDTSPGPVDKPAKIEPVVPPDFGPKPPVPVDFNPFRGWPIFDVMRRMGRGLSAVEIEAARAAGVLIPEEVKPVNDGPIDRTGFDLDSKTPKVNHLKARTVYAYSFTGNGKKNIVWGVTPDGGNGGEIETWISVSPSGEDLGGSYQKMMYNNAGSTVFTGSGGTYYFNVRLSKEAGPVVQLN